MCYYDYAPLWIVFKINNNPIPQTNCYTYLGIPFDNKLSLKPVIAHLCNKIRKALFAIKKFLHNSNISLYYKKLLFNAVITGGVSYFVPFKY